MNPHDTRKIVVVEDHQLVGEFYPHIFKEFQTSIPFPLEVVDILCTEKEAVDFVEKNSEIDLLLMDLYLSQNEHVDGPAGLRIARKLLKEVNPALNIMFVTQSVEGCWIYQAYNLGVKGYIAKHSPAEELVQAIVTVLSGGLYYRGKVRDKMDDYRAIRPPVAESRELTSTEASILQLIAKGFTTQEIADIRGRSRATIETQRSTIMQKLEAANMAHMIAIAYQKGYLR